MSEPSLYRWREELTIIGGVEKKEEMLTSKDTMYMLVQFVPVWNQAEEEKENGKPE